MIWYHGHNELDMFTRYIARRIPILVCNMLAHVRYKTAYVIAVANIVIGALHRFCVSVSIRDLLAHKAVMINFSPNAKCPIY